MTDISLTLEHITATMDRLMQELPPIETVWMGPGGANALADKAIGGEVSLTGMQCYVCDELEASEFYVVKAGPLLDTLRQMKGEPRAQARLLRGFAAAHREQVGERA